MSAGSKRTELIRQAIEVAGAVALSYGAYLLAPWLGWVVAGLVLLLWSFGISQAREKAQKDAK